MIRAPNENLFFYVSPVIKVAKYFSVFGILRLLNIQMRAKVLVIFDNYNWIKSVAKKHNVYSFKIMVIPKLTIFSIYITIPKLVFFFSIEFNHTITPFFILL